MKIAIVSLLVILLLVVVFLAYMEMFSKVSIVEKKMGPYTYAFVSHTGAYSGVGKPMMELYEKMTEAGFSSVDGIGIYYDDPNKTPKENLRSDVGSIIRSEDAEKIEVNRDKFNFATLEEREYIVTEFPLKNKMSFMFGPMKVYPAFAKYLKNKNISVPNKGIEYYDMSNNKIIFMMETN